MLADTIRRSTAAFTHALECSGDRTIRPFIEALRTIDASRARPARNRARENPALDHLPRAFAAARGDERLVAAMRAMSPRLSWASSYAPKGRGAYLATRMGWGEIAGPYGLVATPSLRFGCFLLSPRMVYALHGHMAEEIYFVLSGLLEVEHGFEGTRTAIPPGAFYHTPPSEPHALHIGEEPVLLVYQWVGDIAHPTWLYERDAGGAWVKVFPEVARG